MLSPGNTMRKIGAAAGLVGPALFAIVLLTLTLVQYPFMRSLGWDPIRHPTFDWPSGLALGPIGWIMTVTFILSGVFMSLFAWGLRAELRDLPGQIGTVLMMWGGVAMMGLAFATDRAITPLPTTWHGRLHDISFMSLGLMLVPAMILLAISFRRNSRWKRLSTVTWITFVLAMPTFAIKGFVFYAFLVVMLLWNELAAIRLWMWPSEVAASTEAATEAS